MSDKIKTNQEQTRHPKRALKLAGAAAVVAASFTAGQYTNGDSTDHVDPITTLSPENKINLQTEQGQQQIIANMQRQIESLTQVVAIQAGVDTETINGSLPTVDTLPGYGKKISPETRKAFEGTVLKMGKRPKGSEEPWQEVCTANKVSYKDPDGILRDYVLTAAHCFTRDDVHLGGKGGGDTLGLDITEASPYEYAVLDTTIPSEQRIQSSLATVQSSAILYGGSDLALFTINSTPAFEAMPSLALDDTAPTIVPGQEVALRSLPAASGNQVVTDTGFYLGRINGYDIGGISPVYDVVGVRGISAEDEDPCNYGASGSSAMTAEGLPLFSLSIRNQPGAYEDGTTNVIDGAPNMNRYLFSDALGIDVVGSNFDALCAFAVPLPGDIQRLLHPVDPTPLLVDPSTEQIAGGK